MSAKKQSEPTRFLALYDIHVGREYKRSAKIWPKRLELRNTHDLKALKIAREFAADFQPHVVLLGGDQLNCGPISHWNRGKPRLTEGFRLREEMDILNNEVLQPLEAIVKKTNKEKQRLIWLQGNHECFDDKTEILTQDGWKGIGELYQIHDVWSVNPETRRAELVPVTGRVMKHFRGNLVTFKNRGIDLAVTPGHRMFSATRKTDKYRFENAENITNGERSFLVAAENDPSYERDVPTSTLR